MVKETCFKVRGRIKNEDPEINEDFNVFIKAIDDRHAVLKVKEYLRVNAPSVDGKMIGRIIIEGVTPKKI
ncbi:MAG: hypothetical protein NPINA01_03660 [Nitrospinaceae bacterium]|nr:MAG: hypothetical protein NPINA01_03660 [Nitrospinaceae bacterium]